MSFVNEQFVVNFIFKHDRACLFVLNALKSFHLTQVVLFAHN